MTENQYQAGLIRRIKGRFPEAVVLKNDTSYQQGMLDLTILLPNFHASLEVKKSPSEPLQPNQGYFIDKLHGLSFAACIFPENEEAVLDALQAAFETARGTRIS